jgi:hypothetical protein
MSNELDAQLRDLVSSLVAEAPTYEQKQVASHTAARRRTPKFAAVVALVAVLGLVVAASILVSHGGSHAPASRPVVKFCGLLGEIKATAEAPPSLPDPTHGEAGLALLAKRYDELERVAPTAAITRWLVAARPLLGHGLVRFTPAVRAAIPPAQKLRTAFQHTCGLDVSDVFKVGFP